MRWQDNAYRILNKSDIIVLFFIKYRAYCMKLHWALFLMPCYVMSCVTVIHIHTHTHPHTHTHAHTHISIKAHSYQILTLWRNTTHKIFFLFTISLWSILYGINHHNIIILSSGHITHYHVIYFSIFSHYYCPLYHSLSTVFFLFTSFSSLFLFTSLSILYQSALRHIPSLHSFCLPVN